VEVDLMRSHFLPAIALTLVLQLGAAAAQSAANADRPGMDSLSLEQQSKVGQLITKDAGMPNAPGRFQVAVGNMVPPEVQLRPVPAVAGEAAPQIQNKSYAVVEEQIVIVDPASRKITAVLQRGTDASSVK
jgi:hypothetical protein